MFTWIHRGLLALSLASFATADCTVAWPSGAQGSDTWGASHRNLDPTFAFAREVADDFDVQGSITRLYVNGYNGGPTGSATPVAGVWVRFFAWTPNGPGALQSEQYVLGSSPDLGVEPRPSGVEVALSVPFFATGLHFVSVQVEFAAFGWWEPWRSNQGAPRNSTGYVRTNGGAWSLHTPLFETLPLLADVDFVLFTDAGPSCAEWAPVVVPAPNTDSGLVDVVVVAANDVWALGNKTVTTASTLESFPFALRHDGSTWSVVDLPPTPPLGTIGSRSTMEAIDATSRTDVWAAGARYMVIPGGWVGHQVRVDHYDGSTWTTMNTPLPASSGSAGYSGSRVTDIEAIAPNDVWFVGEWVGPYPGALGSEPALAMHWNGSSFTLVPTPEVLPNGGNGLDAIDGVAANDLWAVGGGGDGDLTNYSYILHWGGTQWTRVLAPMVGIQQRLNDVVAIATDDVWVAGEAFDGVGYLGFVQHWDGANWSTVPGAPTSFSPSFHAKGPDDLWLGLWHWDGAQWQQEHVNGCHPWSGAGSLSGGFGRLFAVGADALPGRVPWVLERIGNCGPLVLCSGDGSGAACPCAGVGSTGHGCPNSVHASGARLAGSGSARLSSDTLVLSGTSMPNGTAFYFQGTTSSGAGFGVPYGDGLLCASGTAVRLRSVQNAGGGSQFPSAGDPAVSVRGHVSTPGPRVYQVLYRNVATFCTPATFNLSNGIEVLWEM